MICLKFLAVMFALQSDPLWPAKWLHRNYSLKTHKSYKYTILLVGTNNIASSRSIDEIMSYFNDLINIIKARSSTNIIVSVIIPRPCNLPKDPTERRVKKMNSELQLMCKRRHFFAVFAYLQNFSI